MAVELEVAELTRYFNYGLDVPITVRQHFNYNLDIPITVQSHFNDQLDVPINAIQHFNFLEAPELDDTPVGCVYQFAGPIANIPSGYLLCNGASLLRSSYASLFAALGTVYGAADGSHFNLPDFRDKMLIGATQDDSGVPKTNVTGALTQSGGSITLVHANGAVTRGPSGVNVSNHSDHVHSGQATTQTSQTSKVPLPATWLLLIPMATQETQQRHLHMPLMNQTPVQDTITGSLSQVTILLFRRISL